MLRGTRSPATFIDVAAVSRSRCNFTASSSRQKLEPIELSHAKYASALTGNQITLMTEQPPCMPHKREFWRTGRGHRRCRFTLLRFLTGNAEIIILPDFIFRNPLIYQSKFTILLLTLCSVCIHQMNRVQLSQWLCHDDSVVIIIIIITINTEVFARISFLITSAIELKL